MCNSEQSEESHAPQCQLPPFVIEMENVLSRRIYSLPDIEIIKF